MQDQNTHVDGIVSIEIYIDPSGISTEDLDECTRQLASDLRQLPHKSIGIVGAQVPAAIESTERATQGVVALTLASNLLPQVIELLRNLFLRGQRRSLKLKGPGAIELDLASSDLNQAADAWLNAAMKGSQLASSSESVTVPDGESEPLSSVQEMRERARRHIERGAITVEYKANRAQVIKILNEVLASEIICVLRYKSHYYRSAGINSEGAKAEFLEHSKEAQQHADLVAARIVQLNGAPDFNPEGLASRSRSEYKPGSTLVEMIREDLIAERIAVEFYSEIIRWLGDDDLTTRKMMQEILAVEAQHAEDMKELLDIYQVK